ncbi:hypothetical protein CPT03_19970 [Pedobacter ginsengisoli]|uniref:DUF4350 domain-containing protein n=1 Tax=Pedobacter ginsengisoli TaxID=363852 RepID=A0A2D1UAF8_9SPHI|nr:DUF4350 domain-containing protein [Pedobacter ginsengisoli]ATP58579.1 hypothetical protein CPT03_19970 [Pedobacter ginsengisoli]
MKGLKRYLILSAVFLVGYLLAQYYKPKPTNWTPTYLKEDKIPFGNYLLFHEIHDLFPKTELRVTRDPVYNTLRDKKFSSTSYLFIAHKIELDKLDFKELVSFVKEGNNVFIAAFQIGKTLSSTLKLEIGSSFSDFSDEKSTSVNFVNPTLRAEHDYAFGKQIVEQYFNKIDTSRATVLGQNNDGKPNFIKYSFGKGNIYILPNPRLFTNYSLLNPLGAEYAAKALSYLPTSTNLIWDEHNTRGNIDDSAVLRVIFRNESLRWAYYLSLIGLIVFVIFEMKRRQRIIPVIEPLKNSSLDFVKVVGKVYYQQRDNSDIAKKKINYFLEHIRSTYNLKTTTIDKELETALNIRSGVQQETIGLLFNTIEAINANHHVDDAMLINLNKLIERFYKQAQ